MIHKDPSNTKIHKLQVIHLYEADLNFLLEERRNVHSAKQTSHANKSEGDEGGWRYGTQQHIDQTPRARGHAHGAYREERKREAHAVAGQD